LDPTRPVNLQVYESGDLEVANWTERVQTLDNETPLVVFSKTYCPYSKAAKAVLKQYDLSPAPSIVEVDLREDGGILKALLTRLTGRGTFPNVVLQGKTLGGYDDLWALHQAGVLQSTFERAGVKVRGNV
ncbi:thioredoxin-like protein, partial [Auriscalpium vulgare]